MAAPDYATEIAALEAAAASGELTVESDGDRVTYRSMDHLMQGLEYFRRQAAKASASTVNAPAFGATVAAFCRD